MPIVTLLFTMSPSSIPVTSGAFVSSTFTVNVAFPSFPALSVTVYVTVYSPTTSASTFPLPVRLPSILLSKLSFTVAVGIVYASPLSIVTLTFPGLLAVPIVISGRLLSNTSTLLSSTSDVFPALSTALT